MLDVAQKCVEEHKIEFITHPEPSKSKMKGIIFTRKHLKFSLGPELLNGLPLPWIEDDKYLGNTITSIPDGFGKDTRFAINNKVVLYCAFIAFVLGWNWQIYEYKKKILFNNFVSVKIAKQAFYTFEEFCLKRL